MHAKRKPHLGDAGLRRHRQHLAVVSDEDNTIVAINAPAADIAVADVPAVELGTLERLVAHDVAARIRHAAADLLWEGPLAALLEAEGYRWEAIAEGQVQL